MNKIKNNKIKMLNVRKFKEEQLKLSNEVILKDSKKRYKIVAGVDQAFVDDQVISAIVVLDKDMKIIEKKYAIVEELVPYVPGYLFYREGPAMVDVFHKLENKPDLLMVDGSGIIHPRRIGMATHLGLTLDIPTIGVTKKLMCGDIKEGKVYVDKEIRGIELKTRDHARPIYVSPGHNISLGTSIELVTKYLKYPHKMPEPLHYAHRYANKIRKGVIEKED